MDDTVASRSYINLSLRLILSNMPLPHLDAESQATNIHAMGQKAQGPVRRHDFMIIILITAHRFITVDTIY